MHAIFLDRDDTIIIDKVYLNNPDQIELTPGTVEAIRLFNERKLPVIIITNQSGIARGLLDEEILGEIHQRLIEMLEDAGATIDAIYYCPHHPEGSVPEYSIECDCRKPAPGMLLAAAEEFALELKQCYMVGDKEIDVETIHNLGGKGVLVGKDSEKADFSCSDMLEAARWILRDMDA